MYVKDQTRVLMLISSIEVRVWIMLLTSQLLILIILMLHLYI